MADYSDLNLTENPTFGSIQKLIGADKASQLTFYLGGKRVYIPYKLSKHHPIAVSIGMDDALKICNAWGGQVYNVPFEKAKSLKAQQKQDQGKSAEQIAREMNISRRHVFRLLKQKNTDSGQLDLF